MTKQQSAHAEKVVARFKELLGTELSQTVGDAHFNELALLIEAAIDAAVFDAEERIIGMLSDLSQRIRKDAEFFDTR
ncbi:MAG: hypothetical protein ACFCUG_04405 [Thiotrichales bacterium]